MIFRINFTKYILLLVSFSFLTANSLNQSLNKFSIDLFKKINKNEDKNILISPLSVSYALMMVNKGASGNTSDNILSTLNIKSSDIKSFIKQGAKTSLPFFDDKQKQELKDVRQAILSQYMKDQNSEEFLAFFEREQFQNWFNG